MRWDDMTCTCTCTTSLRWRWCLVAMVTFDFEMGWVVVVKEVVYVVCDDYREPPPSAYSHV